MAQEVHHQALEIIEAANQQGLLLRLLGGLAVRLHSPSATHQALVRTYPDIDLITLQRQGRAVETLLNGMGYTPDKAFNLLNGDTRLLFYDEEHQRQIDVFVGKFEMCHPLPIAERLDLEPLTIPLAELLLTKLQIVQINEKDLRDVSALLLDHPLGDADNETINLQRITQLCGKDWGLWKTVTINLDKTRRVAAAYDLDDQAQQTLLQRVDQLRRALDDAPKSLKWKTRAALGERVPWYTLPEEVDRG